MINRATLFILLISCSLWAAQHTLTNLKSNSVNIIDADTLTYSPGDTFNIPAGTYAGLRLLNFSGAKEKPLLFRNSGGQVIIEEEIYHGIAFHDGHYIHLAGTGDPAFTYGIYVKRVERSGVGVVFTDLSSDVEINNIEIANTGFAGIMAKTDPHCDYPETWRRNGYIFRNLHIHHNYIHETHGEAMYIGYTGGYKVESNKICDGEYAFGHWFENVLIDSNLIENAGWDGIQVNMVRSNGVIRNNKILTYGTGKEVNQNFGMSIGGGEYTITGNLITNEQEFAIPKSAGIQLINCERGLLVSNNVISMTGGYGIFVHNRTPIEAGEGAFAFLHNTIAHCGTTNIFYNGTITKSEKSDEVGTLQEQVPIHYYNNLLLTPGADYESINFWKKEPECFLDFIAPSTRDSALQYMAGNILSRTPDTLGLRAPSDHLYHPKSVLSPVVDKGIDLSGWGVEEDVIGIKRPVNGAYDIGAYEFSESAVLHSQTNSASGISAELKRGIVTLESAKPITALSIYSLQGQQLKSYDLPTPVTTLHMSLGEALLGRQMLLLHVHIDGRSFVKKCILE